MDYNRFIKICKQILGIPDSVTVIFRHDYYNLGWKGLAEYFPDYFRVSLNKFYSPRMSERDIAECLAHEMIYVNQWHTGRFTFDDEARKLTFDGSTYPYPDGYTSYDPKLPWEREAYEGQADLATKAIKLLERNNYELFRGVNPTYCRGILAVPMS